MTNETINISFNFQVEHSDHKISKLENEAVTVVNHNVNSVMRRTNKQARGSGNGIIQARLGEPVLENCHNVLFYGT